MSMADKDDQKKISDNPSTAEMKALLPGLKALGGIAGFLGGLGYRKEQLERFRDQVNDLTEKAAVLDLPDRFNSVFGSHGWIAVGSALSVDVMAAALALHEDGKTEEAEHVLVEWFTKDNIERFAILRAKRFHRAQLRDDQLKEALELYLEERYFAAVPLILIACDGFASDVAPTSPFEKDADLSCFDSITGHSTALPALIKLLTKGVRKSRDDAIDLPLRHGILHGRSLGYANKKVCAKACPTYSRRAGRRSRTSGQSMPSRPSVWKDLLKNPSTRKVRSTPYPNSFRDGRRRTTAGWPGTL